MSSINHITINSKHITDSINSQLILLVKTLQIEQQANFEDALETARVLIAKKQIELMDEVNKQNVKKTIQKITDDLKKNPKNETLKYAYNSFKYLQLIDMV